MDVGGPDGQSVCGWCGLYSHVTCVCPGSCESDWVYYKNKCYYTSTQRLNWHDAEENCNMRRGHLMVVKDKQEMVNNTH